jgi:hypothetical protein
MRRLIRNNRRNAMTDAREMRVSTGADIFTDTDALPPSRVQADPLQRDRAPAAKIAGARDAKKKKKN